MKLIITAVVFFISFALKKLAIYPGLTLPPSHSPNESSLAILVPGFVDVSRVYNSRNFTLAGYTTIRSIRGVLERSGIDLTDERLAILDRAEFKMSSVCQNQHLLALDIVRSVESIWNSTMDQSPYGQDEFSYGTFRESAVGSIPQFLLHLEKHTESVGREFVDLGDRLANLITNLSEEALLRTAEEQYLFGEALVQFTSSVLFVGNIALSVTSVQANLLQVGVRATFVEEGNGSVGPVLTSLEQLYETGLSLVVPDEVLENVCDNALL